MTAKATRTNDPNGETVESQNVSRYQARNPPSRYDVWEAELVDNASIWYANVPARILVAFAAIIVCAVSIAFLVAL